MADYTPWDINDYLPGKPLTTSKAISYHENLDAFAEGAPDAPRLLLGALEELAPGTTTRIAQSGVGPDIATYGAAISFGCLQTGSIRAVITGDSNTENVRVRRIRSGVSTTVASDNNALGGASLNVLLGVLPGDLVLLEGSGSGTGAGAVEGVSDAEIQTDGSTVWGLGDLFGYWE